VKVFDKP